MGALYYNGPENATYSDIAREIMYKCRKIRMMNPNDHWGNVWLLWEIKELVDKKLVDLRVTGAIYGTGTSNTD